MGSIKYCGCNFQLKDYNVLKTQNFANHEQQAEEFQEFNQRKNLSLSVFQIN